MPRRRVKRYEFVGDCEFTPDAFWDRVEHNPQTGCDEWTGPRNNAGYGLCGYITPEKKARMMTAHRMAWILHHQQLVPAGEQVQHVCHNLLCCTPHHLKLGDHQTKMKDMMREGRHGFQLSPGSRSIKGRRDWHLHYDAMRKYSEEEIQWCRIATPQEIAERFGVSEERGMKIRRYMRSGYRWLPYDQAGTQLKRGRRSRASEQD